MSGNNLFSVVATQEREVEAPAGQNPNMRQRYVHKVIKEIDVEFTSPVGNLILRHKLCAQNGACCTYQMLRRVGDEIVSECQVSPKEPGDLNKTFAVYADAMLALRDVNVWHRQKYEAREAASKVESQRLHSKFGF